MSERSFRGSIPALMTIYVFLLASFGWSSGATLDRQIWVSFDGQGLRIQDEMNCGLKNPQRFSVREPWRLESVEHLPDQVVLSSLEPGERGFPVGGNAHLFVSATLAGSVWQPIPFSPAGWDFDEARLSIHHGPGWMLLAVLGGGPGDGTWLDDWTITGALALVVLTLAIGFCVSRRTAILLLGGLVLAGVGSPWLLGAFLVTSLVIGGLSLFVRYRDKGRREVHMVLLQILLVWGIGITVYSLQQILSVVDPGHVGWKSMTPKEFIDFTDDQKVTNPGPRRITLHRSGLDTSKSREFNPFNWVRDSVDTIVDEEYGAEGDWGRHTPDYPCPKAGVVGGLEPDGATWNPNDDFWIPDEDPSLLGPAALGLYLPHWSNRVADRKWPIATPAFQESVSAPAGGSEASDSAGMANGSERIPPPVVTGDQTIRLIVLPPQIAALWRILSVVCLWFAWILAFRRLLRVWPVRTCPVEGGPGLVSLAVFFIAAGSHAQESSCPVETVRDVRLSRESIVVTRVIAMAGHDPIVRIPLFPGERPIDPVLVEDGKIVLKRKEFRLPRKKYPTDTLFWAFDSLRSGGWKALLGEVDKEGYRLDPQWTSRFDPDTTLLLRASLPGGLCETWRVFYSERWDPLFEGIPMQDVDRFRNGRWIVFWPKLSDTLRIRLQPARRAPLVRARVNQSRWTLSQPDLSRSVLDLRLVVASTDTLRLDLPEGASEVACWRNRKKLESKKEADGRFAVVLTPGSCAVRVSWRSPGQSGWLRRPPLVTLSVEGQDASVGLPIDSGKWIPALHGPGLGPAEGWWMGLIAYGLLALGLLWKYRIPKAAPDLALAWLGASLVSPLMVVAFPMVVLAHRPASTTETGILGVPWTPYWARKRNGLGWIALVGLFFWLAFLVVRGPLSPAIDGALLWYTDFAGPDLMRPWMVVLPGWAWKVAVIGSMAWLVSLGIRLVGGKVVHSDV